MAPVARLARPTGNRRYARLPPRPRTPHRRRLLSRVAPYSVAPGINTVVFLLAPVPRFFGREGRPLLYEHPLRRPAYGAPSFALHHGVAALAEAPLRPPFGLVVCFAELDRVDVSPGHGRQDAGTWLLCRAVPRPEGPSTARHPLDGGLFGHGAVTVLYGVDAHVPPFSLVVSSAGRSYDHVRAPSFRPVYHDGL